jgi:hypothetical protein
MSFPKVRPPIRETEVEAKASRGVGGEKSTDGR